MTIESEGFEVLEAAGIDCERRLRTGRREVERAEADWEALDARVVAAGLDPVEFVNRVHAKV